MTTLEQLAATVDQLVRRARYFDEMQAWFVQHEPRTTSDLKSAELRAKHGVAPFPEPSPQPARSVSDGIEERAQSFWQSPKNDRRGYPVLFVEFARSEIARATAQLRAELDRCKEHFNEVYDDREKLRAELAERDALRARVKKPSTPKRLKYGAEIVRAEDGKFDVRTKNHCLWTNGFGWNKRDRESDKLGMYESYDLALAALNNAPPPPKPRKPAKKRKGGRR